MNDSLKNKLSPLAYKVTQQKGTEPPFSGDYHDFDEPGEYYCICCDAPLFVSSQKFYSSCGWPAFSQALDDATNDVHDSSHDMIRTEILCKSCSAHLGHKFNDGPAGTRYCINSVSLRFEPN